METTVPARAPSTSRSDDGPVSIGVAARRVGLAPSAIRYYESEGLIDPPARPGGRRRYGRDELRRLAFIATAREMGLGLGAIRALLRPGATAWADLVDAQVAELDALIARATRTKQMLLSARNCPTAQPVRDCPTMAAALDSALAPYRRERDQPGNC